MEKCGEDSCGRGEQALSNSPSLWFSLSPPLFCSPFFFFLSPCLSFYWGSTGDKGQWSAAAWAQTAVVEQVVMGRGSLLLFRFMCWWFSLFFRLSAIYPLSNLGFGFKLDRRPANSQKKWLPFKLQDNSEVMIICPKSFKSKNLKAIKMAWQARMTC